MIIYGPTIEDLNILSRLLEGLNKYKGIFPGEEELLIIAGDRCYHDLRRMITDEMHDLYFFSSREWIILNADLAHQVDCQAKNIIFYSLKENNLIIRRWKKENKPVIYLKEENLTLFDGEEELPIISIRESGLSRARELYSILFAIALGFIIELPLFILRRMLKRIVSFKEDNCFSIIF